MKKLWVVIMLFISVFTLSTVLEAQSKTTHIYVHYYRYNGDYDGWNVWMWQNAPAALGGNAYQFEIDNTDETVNFGGVVAKIALEGDLENTSRAGIIVRLGEWAAKDGEVDRFIDVEPTSPGGIQHVYLVQGDLRIGSAPDDPAGPDRNPKFLIAYFEAMNKIYFQATESVDTTSLRVLANGLPITVESVEITNNTGVVTLSDTVDFGLDYMIETQFSNHHVGNYAVTYDGIYDSAAFEAAYGYMGNDLGARVVDGKTHFKIWAPISSSVTLKVYDTGTPSNYGGTNTPVFTLAMQPSEKGTFSVSVDDDLHGYYYTYYVTNGSASHEVIDPYARSAGINGLRGMIVDFSRVNPQGFLYNDRPNNMTHPTDAIVYELQVRDLTSHESWTGSEENRARYLGLIESGTSYNGVSTGFDHIVELGVTHVQLLPFFDFGHVDETRVLEPGYNAFNWGYMPMNFNVLEGSFSADPYDGLVRVQEMKQVVMGFHDADIRIIMDVVYNHTGLTADSNFNLIVPNYYFRKNPDGSFSNGSGTGNETASERIMMRQFILDSVQFWAQEYNISGFRFDLMALHDVETMNQIVELLHGIDPTIMVYGEPWMGGSTPLPASLQAGKQNLMQMPYVGAFNDDLRDAVKGSVFARDQGGFIQGDFSNQVITRMRYGIAGGIDYEGINGALLSPVKIWHGEPYKTVNYVTAHDNNTLHDKLYQTLEPFDQLDRLFAMQKQANAIVLTSQGIAFLHAGDEFLRSKPHVSGSGFDHNSYESLDSVNQLRWDQKATDEGLEMFAYYQGLIALRNAHPSFRMPNAAAIRNHLTFLEDGDSGMIAFTLSNYQNLDAWDHILVIHNAQDKTQRLRLPSDGGWVLVVNETVATGSEITQYLGGQRILIPAHSTYVLYQDSSIDDTNPWPLMILYSALGLTVIGLISGVIFIQVKRKV